MHLQAFIKGMLQNCSLLSSILPEFLATQARDSNCWQEKECFDKIPQSLWKKSNNKPGKVPQMTVRLV